MPLFYSGDLTTVARARQNEIRTFSLNESTRTHNYFDIFLSHSFLDRNVVFGLYLELKDKGFSVYVDWIVDPNLDRNNITEATAKVVRQRLNSSASLLYAISTNAQMSKWMPWELGFIDGHTGRCAIVPVSDHPGDTAFKGKEYLSLYPIMKKAHEATFLDKLWVANDSYSYVQLNEWIKHKTDPFFHSHPIR